MKSFSEQLTELYRNLFPTKKVNSADNLVYAATRRCPCGLGLAHVEGADPWKGYWDCSGILLGIEDRSKEHTAKLPFVFYDIKSENQPSAKGSTTRPKKAES